MNTDSPSQIFGQDVRQTRERRGWTREELADRMLPEGCGVTEQRRIIEQIESGVRRVTLEEVEYFAQALKVPIYSFMEYMEWVDP